ncbi:TonB-dependent receptor [Pedobacter sp. P351]|uniref:TonB-dependent receptor plug domain-containing protein n=1 Tax=Pedobacter superstes TaxID=3133441 RepID=UPI0030A9B5CA
MTITTGPTFVSVMAFQKRFTFTFLLFTTVIGYSPKILAQTDRLPTAELKDLSLEELLNTEVTSVSKRAEKLTEVASAIQVITQSDIHNSGVKTLPEALRLASNLHVAQVNAEEWAISARGFNNVLANKLLVLIDGRIIYTPLYAGVFWDIQNLVLEDVERIEVISGPGGTQWGANAVNGVINITTKSSEATQGLFAEGAVGTAMRGLGSLRYGGKLAENLTYKIYGTGFRIGSTIDTIGTNANDRWWTLQGGMRLDWNKSGKDNFTLQQNLFKATPDPEGVDGGAIATGNNILFRWNHQVSERFDFAIQAYWDKTIRDNASRFKEELNTSDIEIDGRYQLGARHALSFGSGARLMDHYVNNVGNFKFLPGSKNLYIFNVFLQDEILLIKERLRLTLGSKIEHHTYTGFQHQPNGRLTWTAASNHTVWAAISRAVRTPSRLDRDISLFLDPSTVFFIGNKNFKAETLLAYELGWRLQPIRNISLAVSTFYNIYDNIRTAEPPTPPAIFPIVTLGNGVKGNTYGLEIASDYIVSPKWSIKGGYSFFKRELSLKPDSKDLNRASAESNDPRHRFLIQSNLKLAKGFELGSVMRYVGKLTTPPVTDYAELDLRLGCHLTRMLELSIVGQNLLDNRHLEFIPASPSAREMERSVYGKLSFRY